MPTLKMTISSIGHPLVTARINGTERRFLVDTGSTHSIFGPEIFSVSQLTNGKKSIANGIGGESVCFILTIDFNFVGKSIKPRASDFFSGEEGKLDGIIGQDLLSQFSEVVFDYRNKLVRFTP